MLRTPPNRSVKCGEFVGHTGAIENVAFTPDGRAAHHRQPGHDRPRLGRGHRATSCKTLTGHTGPVRGLAVLPDNRRAVTAGLGRNRPPVGPRQRARKFGSTSATRVRSGGWRATRPANDCSPAARIGPSASGTSRPGSELKRLTGHMDIVTAAVFLPDGRRAVTASDDRIVAVVGP